jgi:hypothetical protein
MTQMNADGYGDKATAQEAVAPWFSSAAISVICG